MGGRASLHHGIFAGAGPFGGPFGLLLLDGQVVEQGRLQLSHGTFEDELGRGVEWLLGQGAGRRGQRGRWGQEPGHAPVVPLLGGDVVGCVLPLAAAAGGGGQGEPGAGAGRVQHGALLNPHLLTDGDQVGLVTAARGGDAFTITFLSTLQPVAPWSALARKCVELVGSSIVDEGQGPASLERGRLTLAWTTRWEASALARSFP